MRPPVLLVEQLLHLLDRHAAGLDQLQVLAQLLRLLLQVRRLLPGVLDLLLHGLDLGHALRLGHLLAHLQDLAVLLGAGILGLQAAGGPRVQLGLHLPLHRLEIPAAVVIHGLAVDEELDGGIALHTVLAARRLRVARAIEAADDDVGGVSKRLPQLIEVRLQLPAVAAPWRLKEQERILAVDDLLEVGVAEIRLQGTRPLEEQGHGQQRQARHDIGSPPAVLGCTLDAIRP
mmetsp:Transcript_31325/g.89461  ORF Transcript_31325/g.89461 Transcript_31325/m.89461 type:complete len:232 (-) Transcript_31325:1-696(-)